MRSKGIRNKHGQRPMQAALSIVIGWASNAANGKTGDTFDAAVMANGEHHEGFENAVKMHLEDIAANLELEYEKREGS